MTRNANCININRNYAFIKQHSSHNILPTIVSSGSSQRSKKTSLCPAKRSPLDYLVNRAEVRNTGKVGAVIQLLLEAPPDEATPPTQMKPCKHKCKRIKTYFYSSRA